MERASLRRRAPAVVAALAALTALVPLPSVAAPAAAGPLRHIGASLLRHRAASRLKPERLQPAGGVSVTYATGVLAATGAVVPVTVKISGATRASTCILSYNPSNPSPVFVAVSPLKAVSCRSGRAQFKVTLGSNVAPVVTTVPLQFSFNVSTTLSEVHDLSLQVAAGPADGAPVPPGQGLPRRVCRPSATRQGRACAGQGARRLHRPPTRPRILHWQVAFGYSPAKTAAAIAQLAKAPLNAVPLLDWSPASACGAAPSKGSKCVAWLKGVASGADDRTVKAMAAALKTFGKPMLLRFFGEMNLHILSSSGKYFIAAWDHVVALFSKENVANVAFVWVPGLTSGVGTVGATGLGGSISFFPGASEVDWIGIDAYDHESYGPAGFGKFFAPWYAEWGNQGRPMMISVTAARTRGVKTGAQSCPAPARVGALGDEQAQYIKSIGTALNPTSPAVAQYPNIKAFVYWDSSGAQGPYCFDKGGLKAFKNLEQEPFFSFMSPNE